jgi:hypothetical protein
LLAANDHESAALGMGATNYLEREDSPSLNTFLITLCWASITAAAEAVGDSDDGSLPESRGDPDAV